MSRREWLLIAVIGVGITVPLAGWGVIEYTNSNAFCTSCHSMDVVAAEYYESVHFVNTAGVRATCADCHVPDALGPLLAAKLLAAKDVYHEIVGTIETPALFEEHRWRLANLVWDKMLATDSRECRTCHTLEAMDLTAQDRRTARRHERAQRTGVTCVACHKGVAHVEPDPPPEDVPSAG